MKLLRVVAAIFCLLAVPVLSSRAETLFLGPIPVQYTTRDKALILDMHRFFHPAGAKLDFGSNPDLNLAFDAVSFQLRIRPAKQGLTNLEITAKSGKESRKTILTVAASGGQSAHRFAYKAKSGTAMPEKVFLAGIFNGWSTDKTPLSGPNENGEYSVEVPLQPGKYAYKFVVNGKWTIDPANPETEDNGMGDKNSVVTIAGEKQAKPPTIYADRLTGKALYLRNVSDAPLATVSAVLDTDAGSTLLSATINGNNI